MNKNKFLDFKLGTHEWVNLFAFLSMKIYKGSGNNQQRIRILWFTTGTKVGSLNLKE